MSPPGSELASSGAGTAERTNYFDGPVAATYDADTAERFDPAILEPTVDVLAELAGDHGALELAIGTGRVALPLSRRGVRVRGIDLSPDMVARLSEKAGSEAIDVVIGDIATASVGETFGLVYLVFNTIGNLTGQDDQVACFENAARHLRPGGCFVVEVGVPALRRLPPGETIRPFSVGADRFGFDELDPAVQAGVSHHYWVHDGRLRQFSMPFRDVWPAELDLMARIAGLRLRERWSDWDRRPFTNESTEHVSVWEK